MARSAVLTIDTDGSGTDGVRVVDGSEVTGMPEGGVPVAVAVLSMEPASTSACCTTYVAVQTSCAPGARVRSAGQLTADIVPAPVKAVSLTPTLFSVTFPVFVTTKLNFTVSPTTSTAVSEDFLIVMPGVCVAVRRTLEGAEVTAMSSGETARAVAVLSTAPALTSAWRTTYDAVQVVEAPVASGWGSAGQLIADTAPAPVNAVSDTEMSCSGTLPSLVTLNE